MPNLLSVSTLAIVGEDDGTTMAVRPVGEVDMLTADQVDSHLRCSSEEHKAIVFDLSLVTFMDTAGLQMLIEAHNREPRRFALRGHSPAVEHLLQVSGTANLFRREQPAET